MSALLIKGGTVIDGSGAPGRGADVRIREGRIVEIAPGLEPRGETVIDATAAVVTPGFIDVHTHFDTSIYWDPSCDPMPQHGVTTLLIGNCSLGLAPLKSADRPEISALFSFIEDIPLEAFSNAVPWNWESFDDYIADLAGRKLGANIAALISLSLVRAYVMGKEAWERAATTDESERIAAVIGRALDLGAAGVSYSSFDRDPQGRLVPSAFADDAELASIFELLGNRGGIFQVIVTGTGEMLAHMHRIAGFSKRYNVLVLHNAIMNVEAKPEVTQQMVDALREMRDNGASFYSMLSPKTFDMDINFHQTFAFQTFPAWNEVVQAPREQKFALLRDRQWRARACHEFETNTDTALFPTDRMHLLRICAVGSKELRPWIGRSLQDLVNLRGGHPSDVLADWVIETDLEAHFINPLGNADPAGVARLLHVPGTVVGASDAGAHLQMFCTVGDTTLLLTRHVRERGDLTLEDAVHRITGQAASMLNLKDRGLLRPGMAADITVFALNELHYDREIMVDDLPGGKPRLTRPDGGYRCTIVDGVVVQRFGKSTGELPAHFLRAGGTA